MRETWVEMAKEPLATGELVPGRGIGGGRGDERYWESGRSG